MAAVEPAGCELETLLTQSVQRLIGDSAGMRFGEAVSGGPDSMVLLDLSARVFAGRVEAATVDHGLRPASASEAAMVADWCAGRNIAHTILRPAEVATGNIQQWARTRRYALLEAWRIERQIDWVFTAHHADDQLETVLMRLNRGAGVSGLAGVRARQGRLLRPLLGARRVQLLAYAEDRGLPFVEDPSNSDPRFDRAVIRQQLAGAEWLDPVAATRSAAALAEVTEAIEWAVEGIEARHVRSDRATCILDRTDFPREFLRRLLLRMLARIDSDYKPRGETIDRALDILGDGGKVSVGKAMLVGGTQWIVQAAPARKKSLRKGSTD